VALASGVLQPPLSAEGVVWLRPVVRWLLLASAVSTLFTLTHTVEDFSVGIHQRFGLSLLPAAFLVSLVFAAQVTGAALSATDHRLGHLLNLGVALVWFFGSVLDHLPEVLGVPTELYRAGSVSQLLEVGVMALSALWAMLAFLALRRAS
jgi:hypothetical protein